MPELPRPPENTPPWIWVVGTSLAAFIIAATPIVLPRILDSASQSNTVQNIPPAQAPFNLSSPPNPTISQSPIEYKGEPVGDMPFRENAITVDHNPTTITSPINGKAEVCVSESRYTFEGTTGTILQGVKVKTFTPNTSKIITSLETGCTEIGKINKGDKLQLSITSPEKSALANIPRYQKPTISFSN